MTGSAVTTPPVTAPRRFRRPGAPDTGAADANAPRLAALPRAGGATFWGLLGCVAIAALTLLAPAAPTYDPWVWVIWGREIAHLDLNTGFGPSWKPLPVALTTVFSLFGGAAPGLWMVAARAGALAGALFAFRLARRLGGTPAGILAAGVLLVAPWYLRSAALGNSEGLQVAFALAAVDCALVGRRVPAFLLALGLGLLRPEAWLFIAAYGAWLVWRERRRIWLVGAGLASLPLLWLLPEKLGSGDWLRAAHRAQQPVGNSPAFKDNPVVEVVHEGWYMLDRPIHWGLAIALVVAVARRDLRFAVLTALAGAWLLLVAAMTANGYSGNARYLMVPAALAIVVAAAGIALAARGLLRNKWVALAATLAVGWWLVGPWLEPARVTIRATSWQARLNGQLGPLVERAGGAARLRACGQPVTAAYLVPAVAWHLGVHISNVGLAPQRPGVAFRVHTTRDAPALPTLTPFGDLHGLRTLAHSSDWRVVAACGP